MSDVGESIAQMCFDKPALKAESLLFVCVALGNPYINILARQSVTYLLMLVKVIRTRKSHY